MENTKITQNEQKSNNTQPKSEEIVISKEYLDKKIEYYQKIIQRTINSSLKFFPTLTIVPEISRPRTFVAPVGKSLLHTLFQADLGPGESAVVNRRFLVETVAAQASSSLCAIPFCRLVNHTFIQRKAQSLPGWELQSALRGDQ